MSTLRSSVSSRRNLIPLAVGISLALGFPPGGRSAHANAPLANVGARHAGIPAANGSSVARAHSGKQLDTIVDTCADDGSPGSLRVVVHNAPEGGTVDLSQLSCSRITLDGGWVRPQIDVYQDTLYIQGPATKITIDGAFHSRVFEHHGQGALAIYDLDITEGKYQSSGVSEVGGGCITSSGDVRLTNSIVSDCYVETGGTTWAEGGGIATTGNLILSGSALIRNHARALEMGSAEGGGAKVGRNLQAFYSVLQDNEAVSANKSSDGGGALVEGNILFQSSTVSGNYSDALGGGLENLNSMGLSFFYDSTISNNRASAHGGLWIRSDLKIVNSTIAFNSSFSQTNTRGAGLYQDEPSSTISILSSIISGNASADGESDLYAKTNVAGAQNIIVVSNSIPADTDQSCPQLDLLANNGGPTLTHGLQPTSPAIDHGSANGQQTDQRLLPRVTGSAADIGSFERQPADKTVRLLASGFDGLCDQ